MEAETMKFRFEKGLKFFYIWRSIVKMKN